MMERRLAARIPVVMFTVRLTPGPHGEKPGEMKILFHSTDWIGHMLFSPTDPDLIMYCHEGPWQKVDRIWMIHTDGSHNELIHKRMMLMEIAGHEFWGLDGKTIWYDWQPPKGEDFFLASYDLTTHRRVAYHMQRNEWSIHFNLTQDLDLFTGDGGDSGQVAKAPDGEWIELFRPEMIGHTEGALNSPDFFQPGVFHSEHLVNMAWQNYRGEPNVRFSPDKKLVFFTSNMFGPSFLFAVEVAKARWRHRHRIHSRPRLPLQPHPTHPNQHPPNNPGAPGPYHPTRADHLSSGYPRSGFLGPRMNHLSHRDEPPLIRVPRVRILGPGMNYLARQGESRSKARLAHPTQTPHSSPPPPQTRAQA